MTCRTISRLGTIGLIVVFAIIISHRVFAENVATPGGNDDTGCSGPEQRLTGWCNTSRDKTWKDYGLVWGHYTIESGGGSGFKLALPSYTNAGGSQWVVGCNKGFYVQGYWTRAQNETGFSKAAVGNWFDLSSKSPAGNYFPGLAGAQGTVKYDSWEAFGLFGARDGNYGASKVVWNDPLPSGSKFNEFHIKTETETGTSQAVLDGFYSTDTVRRDFEQAIRDGVNFRKVDSNGNITNTIVNDFNSSAAFCYDKDETATYDGRMKVTVGNESRTDDGNGVVNWGPIIVDAQETEVKFTAEMKRTGGAIRMHGNDTTWKDKDGKPYYDVTTWYEWANSGPTVVKYYGHQVGTDWTALSNNNQNDNPTVYKVSLDPGQSQTVCRMMQYDHNVVAVGRAKDPQERTRKACVTLVRPTPFGAEMQADVNGTMRVKINTSGNWFTDPNAGFVAGHDDPIRDDLKSTGTYAKRTSDVIEVDSETATIDFYEMVFRDKTGVDGKVTLEGDNHNCDTKPYYYNYGTPTKNPNEHKKTASKCSGTGKIWRASAWNDDATVANVKNKDTQEHIFTASLERKNEKGNNPGHYIQIHTPVTTRTIEPGETIEVCRSVQVYDGVPSDHNNKDHRRVATACVRIKRKPVPCNASYLPSDELKYGVDQGKNFARLTVTRNYPYSAAEPATLKELKDTMVKNGATELTADRTKSNYQWIASTPHDFAKGWSSNNQASATIYAKPGDNIRFRYDFCAGGEFAASRRNIDANDSIFTIESGSNYGAKGYFFGHGMYEDTNKVATVSTAYEKAVASHGRPDEGFPTTKPYLNRNVPGSADWERQKFKCDTKDSAGFQNYSYQIPSHNDLNRSCNNNSPSLTATRPNSPVLAGGVHAQLNKSKVANSSARNEALHTLYTDVGNVINHSVSWSAFNVAAGVRDSNRSTYTATASVRVPYNYIIKPYLSGSGSTRLTGTSVTAGAYIDVQARKNPIVNGNTDYATHTKPTRVIAVGFAAKLAGNNAAKASIQKTHYASLDNPSAYDICRAVLGSGETALRADTCTKLKETSNTVYNKSIGTELSGSEESYGSVAYTIPNDKIYLGDNACVTFAVYPADSHNLFDNTSNPVTLADDSNQSGALGTAPGSGARWAISAPVCNAIAIRPTFSVESSGILGNTSINGGGYSVASVNNGSKKYHHGSWVEYDLRAKSANSFATGAALAYPTPQTASFTTYQTLFGTGLNPNDEWPKRITRELAFYGTANAPIKSPSSTGTSLISTDQTTTQRDCIVNLQKFPNSNSSGCAALTAGINGLANLSDQIKNTVSRLKNLYQDKSTKSLKKSQSIKNGSVTWSAQLAGTSANLIHARPEYFNKSKLCAYDKNTHKYVRAASETFTVTGGGTLYSCNETNGAKNYHFDGDTYLGGDQAQYGIDTYVSSGDVNGFTGGYTYVGLDAANDTDTYASSSDQLSYRNLTQVIQVDGDLTINTDIILQNSNTDQFKSLQEIPQLLIFADNIHITNRVRRIDAWLIAGSDDGANDGVINTCAYNDVTGVKGGKRLDNMQAVSEKADFIACSRALIINGPVYANQIKLQRTGGGGAPAYSIDTGLAASGDANAAKIRPENFSQRAEIFNLRSDAYLWGFYQSERNAAATTTSTQELPVRY
ncbi:hypothetical protein IKF15_00925 [Candidatus Saccharibacteria bacterium]|nr:hypothetical protein [Candidatus Saccharibacteria bacterium]